MRVRCEDIRAILPEYAEGGLRLAGPVESHLARCERCSAELASYRTLLSFLAELVEDEVAVPDTLLDRSLEAAHAFAEPGSVLRHPSLGPQAVLRVVRDRRVRYALVSLGGAAVGATAVAIAWWRIAHRALGGDEVAAQS